MGCPYDTIGRIADDAWNVRCLYPDRIDPSAYRLLERDLLDAMSVVSTMDTPLPDAIAQQLRAALTRVLLPAVR